MLLFKLKTLTTLLLLYYNFLPSDIFLLSIYQCCNFFYRITKVQNTALHLHLKVEIYHGWHCTNRFPKSHLAVI